MFSNRDEAITYIHQRPKAGKKDSFERMQALLAALGHPENQIPDAIHITGTNGKGSVATMVTAMAVASGLKVGSFTSPYMIDFAERFKINRQNIDDQSLIAYTNLVATAVSEVEGQSANQLQPTEFEVVTAIMLAFFAHADLDLAVIEVGIGGQYDSTNVLTTTKVAVVTTVALDHQAMLGGTIEAIAKQKAGIIKAGAVTVVGPNLPKSAFQVIQERAQRVQSPLIISQSTKLHSRMTGTYQVDNTATAVSVIRAWHPDLAVEDLQKGLDQAFLPGRFEKIKPGFYLDGAHNAAGIKALHQTIQNDLKGPVTVIIGTLAEKNVNQALRELANDWQIRLVLVPFVGPNGRISLQNDQVELPSHEYTWFDSFDQAESAITENETVVVTGSLYFISDVRRKLCKKKS